MQVLREYILPTLAETEGARRRTAEKCARAEAALRARSMRLQVLGSSPLASTHAPAPVTALWN